MIEIKQKYDSQLLKKSKHNGPLIYKNGNVYIGNKKNDKPNGQGAIKYKNGNVYIGEWKDGKKNGEGTMKYSNGDVYIEEWKNGKCQKKEKIIFKCPSKLKRKHITKKEKKSKRRKNE